MPRRPSHMVAAGDKAFMAAKEKATPLSVRTRTKRRVCDEADVKAAALEIEDLRVESEEDRFPRVGNGAGHLPLKDLPHSEKFGAHVASPQRPGHEKEWHPQSADGHLYRDSPTHAPHKPPARLRSMPRQHGAPPGLSRTADVSLMPGSQEIRVGLEGRLLGDQYSLSSREHHSQGHSGSASHRGAHGHRIAAVSPGGGLAFPPPGRAPARQLSDEELDAIRQLKEDAACDDDAARQRAAAAQLRQLAKSCDAQRAAIVEAGAVGPLIRLLRSEDERTREEAVIVLLNLSINNENKRAMPADGAIEALVEVLCGAPGEMRENAAAAIFSLSVVDENKELVGAAGAIPPLVSVLGSGSEQGRRDACKALFNLSILSSNKPRLVEAGAVAPLVAILQEPSAAMAEKAVSVLANIATVDAGRAAIVAEEEGVSGLVEVVEAGSARGKENAAAALWQLCQHSDHHRNLIRQEVVIPPLVALSQNGTPRAKEKANLLLANLREGRHTSGLSELHSGTSSDGSHSFEKL